jgi:hypothetical protein
MKLTELKNYLDNPSSDVVLVFDDAGEGDRGLFVVQGHSYTTIEDPEDPHYGTAEICLDFGDGVEGIAYLETEDYDYPVTAYRKISSVSDRFPR